MVTSILEDILEGIADAESKDPDSLDVVLQDHIEMDAIQQLAAHDSDSWILRFEIPNHSVTIKADGEILVDDIQQQTREQLASK
jgi:hypothetical protein